MCTSHRSLNQRQSLKSCFAASSIKLQPSINLFHLSHTALTDFFFFFPQRLFRQEGLRDGVFLLHKKGQGWCDGAETLCSAQLFSAGAFLSEPFRFPPRTLNDAASLIVLTQQERRLIEMAFMAPQGRLCVRVCLYKTSALDMIGDVRATATKRLVSKRRKTRRLMPPLRARALSPPRVLVKLGPLADKNSNNEFWQGCTRITRNTVRVERRGVVATRAGRTSAGLFDYV